MSYTNQGIHTYPNTTSPQMYMHEGTWLKGCICIINSLDKMDIYMKLNMEKHEKHVQNGEYKLKCMNHQNQTILAHLMGTNKRSNTNI